MILRNEQEFYISERDWNKMQNYAKWAHKEHESEISGMLLAQLDKDNNYRLFKPVILNKKLVDIILHQIKMHYQITMLLLQDNIEKVKTKYDLFGGIVIIQ